MDLITITGEPEQVLDALVAMIWLRWAPEIMAGEILPGEFMPCEFILWRE